MENRRPHEDAEEPRERAKRRGEMLRKGGRCHPQSNEPRDAATFETSRSIMDHSYYDKRENRVTIVPNGGEKSFATENFQEPYENDY
jgi:hypothetical protein